MSEIGTTINGLSGLLLIALGIFVGLVRPRNGARLAFGAFLLTFGLRIAGVNFGWPVRADWQPWIEAPVDFAVALSLVALWCMPSLLGQRPTLRTHGWPAAVSGAYMVGSYWPIQVGGFDPLLSHFIPWTAAFWFGLLLLPALYRRRAAAGDDVEARRAAFLTMAVAIHPGFTAGTTLADGFWWGAKQTGLGFGALVWLDMVMIILVGILWLRTGAILPAPWRRRARNVGLGILALGCAGTLVGWLAPDPNAWGSQGISRLATFALLTIGILRHQLLGIDVKVRWAISKTTLAGVFIAVFFVGSEAAQQFFGEKLGGPYFGIVAAGALVFVLAPLSRVADRLAEKVVPSSPATGLIQLGNAEFYRRQVETAWMDGAMTRREGIILGELRERLNLTEEQARRIEFEAMAKARKRRRS